MNRHERPQCGMAEAVLWLSGGLLFVSGIVVAVLSVQPWRWGE